jgi:hypothetical protein
VVRSQAWSTEFLRGGLVWGCGFDVSGQYEIQELSVVEVAVPLGYVDGIVRLEGIVVWVRVDDDDVLLVPAAQKRGGKSVPLQKDLRGSDSGHALIHPLDLRLVLVSLHSSSKPLDIFPV